MIIERPQAFPVLGRQARVCKRAVRLTLQQIRSEIPCGSLTVYRLDAEGRLCLAAVTPRRHEAHSKDLVNAPRDFQISRHPRAAISSESGAHAAFWRRTLNLPSSRQFVVQPLICGGAVNGVLVAIRDRSRPDFSPQELARLSTLSKQTAASLTNLDTARQMLKYNRQLQRDVRFLSKSVEANRQRATFQRIISAVGKSISENLVMDRLFPAACKAVVEGGEISYCGLAVTRDRCFAGECICRSRGHSMINSEGLHESEIQPLIALAESSRSPRLILVESASPPLKRFLKSRQLRSALCLKLGCGRGYTGVAVIGYRSSRGTPNEIEREFLKTLTVHLCQGIRTALLYSEIQSNTEDLERRNEDLSVLFELGRKLSSTFDLDTTLEFAVNTFVTRLRVDRAAVIYVDPENERRLRIAKAVRPGTGVAAFDVARIEQDSKQLLSMAAAGKMQVAPDMSKYRVRNAYARNYFKEIGLKSAVTIPLVSREHALGLLFLGYTTTRTDFNDRQKRMFALLGSMIASAMENCRLMDFISGRYRRAGWLSTRLFESQERERRKIARNLHDQIGAELALLRINLQMAKKAIAPHGGRSATVIDDLDSELNNVISQVRNLTADLRPPMLDDLGLVSALSWFIDHFSKRTGLRIDFANSFQISKRSAELEAVVYRIVQETLTNVAKHADSTRVKVRLSGRSGECTLTVTDNGMGFDATDMDYETEAKTGFGLASIRQQVENRGGKFTVSSEPGKGTQIKTRIPWLA